MKSSLKSKDSMERLADGLGWFSVALGLSELLVPGGLARLIGVPKHRTLFRVLGLRELASGIGILARPKPAGWVWSRVAGDVMDLSLLAAALSSNKSQGNRIAAATAAVVGVTALDVLCGQGLTEQRKNGQSHSSSFDSPNKLIHFKKTAIIDKSPEELYKFWHNFENLPRFMYHLDAVTVNGNRSHWVAKAPAGSKVEWDAEITQDRPNELIAWRSVGGDVDNSGEVRFTKAPGNRGTLVEVEMQYHPPGGMLGLTVAKLFRREPGVQVHDSLRFFKQLMETGEIPTTKGQSAGRSRSTSKKYDYPTPQRALSASPA